MNPLLRVNAVHLVLLILACDGDIYDGLHLRHGAHAWVDLWVCAGRKSALRVRVRGGGHGMNRTREVIADPSARQTLTLHLRVEWGAYHLRRSGWEGEVGEIVKRPLLTSSQYFARRG